MGLFGMFSSHYGGKKKRGHAAYVQRAAMRGRHARAVSTLSQLERKRESSRRYYAAHKAEINAKRRAAAAARPRRAPKTHKLSRRSLDMFPTFRGRHKIRSIESRIEMGPKRRAKRYSPRRAALA